MAWAVLRTRLMLSASALISVAIDSRSFWGTFQNSSPRGCSAPVSRLQLGPRQPGLDLQHPGPKVVEGGAVEGRSALEVEPDLESPDAGVVPGLEVRFGPAIVELQQAARPAPGLEAAQLDGEPG